MKRSFSVRTLARCALMSALLCVLGPFSIPIGPVPVSLGTFAVSLCAMILGGPLGAVSVLVYLLLGAAGLPVFTGFQGGLAKLAGADMASVTGETVGVYPEAQRVAIQKMLGIYEAPWELIREDTFTNATTVTHEISVDGNGQPFELTDVVLLVESPVQETASAVNGNLVLSNGTKNIAGVYCTGWTQAANSTAHGCWIVEEKKNGLVFVNGKNGSSSTNMQTMTQSYAEGLGNTQAQSIQADTADFVVRLVKIASVLGTCHYKLYGKRKWN